MEFNWNELKKENYTNNKKELLELVDDCIGFIRIGEICVDVVIRDYGEEGNKLAYSYDFYVANEDTGYGYKEDLNIPYDYADGTDLFNLSLSYEDFVKESERIITEFINANDRKDHKYSLIEKANKSLLMW